MSTRPHSRSLRVGRWSEPGQIYLVTTTTLNRRPVFADLADGRELVRALKWNDEHDRSRTWAFVVMPDHLHWLLELRNELTLSKLISALKSFSSKRINQRRGTHGSIWQAGFHDHALRREEDLRAVARYVVMNPVRAGLVASAREYALWDACWI